MKYHILLVLLLGFITQRTSAQFQGPIPAISTGYGSDGNAAIAQIDILNDRYLLKKISIFYPAGTTTPVPTIFYSHGYASTDTTFHIENLRHIASRGYAVVFVPYKSIGVTNAERYATLFDGFVKSARTNPTIIDTTRVGFFGQSFGGGATPRVAYRAFTENNWGVNGKFIYCSAPWYSFELGTTNLSNFPSDCNLLTVLYDDDFTNDHRIGMDVFNNIAIPDSSKDCIIVYSDTVAGYIYSADHNMPSQYTPNGEFDALDSYVTFRLLDALADYSFTGNQTAKNMALGNGSTAQISMGGQLKNLYSSNTPSPIYPESSYTNPCSDTINERRLFCPSVVGIEHQNIEEDGIHIYPNPVHSNVEIRIETRFKALTISILTLTGKEVLITSKHTNININHLPNGIYFLRLDIDGITKVKKIIKS